MPDPTKGNLKAVQAAGVGSCYFCVGHFPESSIQFVERDKAGDTVICPICGVDAVLPGKVPDATLKELHQQSFSPPLAA